MSIIHLILTSRTLRPPSPTTLKKSSIPGKPKLNPEKVISTPSSGVQRPSLPSLNSVELKSPKLADYLEKPRMVSCPSNRLQVRFLKRKVIYYFALRPQVDKVKIPRGGVVSFPEVGV